jgi:hypothetical protein
MYLNSNYNFIIEHISKKKKNIEDLFNSWLSSKKDYYNLMTISPRELNDRFKLLSKPFNPFCKTNYIDYNFVVDQILQMSLPYSEGKQNLESHTQKIDNTFLYESSARQNQQPFKTEYQRVILGGTPPPNYPISVGGSQPINRYPFEPQPAQPPVSNFPSNVNPQQPTNPNNPELIRMESEPFRGPSGYFFNQDQNLSRGPSQLFGMEGNEGEGGNYNDFLRNNMGLRNNISLQSLNK